VAAALLLALLRRAPGRGIHGAYEAHFLCVSCHMAMCGSSNNMVEG
jgi:hypothetical protein